MPQENEKKGLFQRLKGSSKPKKTSCCCIELEEIPEDKTEDKEIKKGNKGSCCG